MPSRKKFYNPTIPRNYNEVSPEGQRAIDKHRRGDFKLKERRKSDDRLCVLFHIAEHNMVSDTMFKTLTRERRTMK